MSKHLAAKVCRDTYNKVGLDREDAISGADKALIRGLAALTKAHVKALLEAESKAQKGFDEADRVFQITLSQLSSHRELTETITISKIETKE